MPIVKKFKSELSSQIIIWHINESTRFYLKQLKISAIELKQLNQIKSEKRRQEWLAARMALRLLCEDEKDFDLVKDEFGKPHLLNSSDYISLSHTKSMAAVVKSKRNTGIDIQWIVPKITSIKHKFVKEAQLTKINPEDEILMLHFIWGAKESMYKAYGRKKIDFRAHMTVENFKIVDDQAKFYGNLSKDETQMRFCINAEKIDEYILVYAEEI